MRKPWSITTTLRNPERLRDFLLVLQEIEGQQWDSENQRKYQILLIKNRVYGFGSTQFYNDLNKEWVSLIDDASCEISFEEAEKIFDLKNYEDPSMRGRQSINPLKKIGLVAIKEGKIFITSLGKLLVKKDFDLGEIFFRSFLKWQIPNLDSDDYNYENGDDIKPFIGVLHLINRVNQKTVANGNSPKGLSKEEFSLFAPTLVNYKDIDKYADMIIGLRKKTDGKNKQEKKIIVEEFKRDFAQNFLGTNNNSEIEKLLKNLKDYGDNTLRYFRLTRYLFIRGGGFYIDLEPRRSIEIENLLKNDNAKSIVFDSVDKYLDYISDINEPKLPWETRDKSIEIVSKLIEEIRDYEIRLKIPNRAVADMAAFND